MLTNNTRITDLAYESADKKFARMQGMTLEESRAAVSDMSFSQYLALAEASADIIPPSGQTISPQSSPAQKSPTPNGASAVKSIWPGKGAPVQQGMTVGLKGPNGLPVPGEVTQVDSSARGVKVRNPTTGQEEWHGNGDLNPYTTANSSPEAAAAANANVGQQMAEDIKRMRQLAGMKEDASCGASGASGIASAPTAMGSVKRREVSEAPPKEYTPDGPAKTIVGDTKPKQASGELSANLAVRGKKTATRSNNGFKR